MISKRTVTTALFWLAFVVFLGVSIPHVAWMFDLYEPGDQSIWVYLSYGVAISIDALVCWLSYIQSTGKTGDKWVTWVFIVLLAGLSWYANYLYSRNFQPAHIPALAIVIVGLPTSIVTPLVVSAIPVFIIAYTYMLSRVNETKSETLAEKVTRLQEEKALRDQLAQVKPRRFIGFVKSTVSDIADVATHTKKTLRAGAQDTETDTGADTEMDTSALEQGYSEDASADIQTSFNGHSEDTGPDTGAIYLFPTNGHSEDMGADTEMDTGAIEQEQNSNLSTRSIGRVYLSLEDASTRYGYSVSYLTKLVQTGKVKTHRSDKTRLLESSLQAYVTKSGRKTLELPVVKVG